MNYKQLLQLSLFLAICPMVTTLAQGQQQTVAQQLSILDERISKLRADVDALQFSQQQIQQDLKQAQAQIDEARRAGPGASANDLQALESRVRAIDEAREKDKKVILDQLSKELASLGSAKGGNSNSGSQPSSSSATADGEYVVQKGETLTLIAKKCHVTVVDLRKANNLTSDSLKVGQKLVIPK